MSPVLLATLSGLVWGVGDFAGGKSAQRASALPVAVVSKTASLPLLALYLLVTAGAASAGSLLWGALGGAAGIGGLLLFYRALASGAMAVVAPVTAVTSAVIPVGVGLLRGDPVTPLRLTGVACALTAIGLVSLAPRRADEPGGVGPGLLARAVGAGAGFALFFLFLAAAGAAAGGRAGLWPVAASQASALAIGGLLLLRRHARAGLPRGRSLGWACLAGPFDMTANALYLTASRTGELSVVAPLAALYPVSTVLLAVLVDRERLRPVQVAGLLLAAAALVLVNR